MSLSSMDPIGEPTGSVWVAGVVTTLPEPLGGVAGTAAAAAGSVEGI